MRRSRWLWAIAAALALTVAGCSGDDGAAGPQGPEGPAGPSYTAGNETCGFCHEAGSNIKPIDTTLGTHRTTPATTERSVSITSVDTTGGNVKVTVHIQSAAGVAFATETSSNLRFTFAQLDGTGVAGDPANWVPHLQRSDTDVAGTFQQGYYQRSNDTTGTFTNLGLGNYSYTLGSGDGTFGGVLEVTPTGGLLAVANMQTWTPANPQRIGVQVSSGVNNAICDFTYTGGVETCTGTIDDTGTSGRGAESGVVENQLVQTAQCNQCHDADGDLDGLAMHGGTRRQVEFCVTCHNATTTDAESGNTVNLKVMIHKIHSGKHLPSVEAGGTYEVGGHDYSTGGFPQEITNCEKCHTGGAQSTNWYAVPSIEACGACHDDVNFTTGTNHAGGIKTNAECGNCHNATATTLENPQLAHRQNLILAEGDLWRYQINTVTYTAATGEVKVNFQVNWSGAPVPLTDPTWAASGSRLSIAVGWKASGKADYTNAGTSSTSTPGAPNSITVVSGGAVDSGVVETATTSVYEATTTLPTTGQAAAVGIAAMYGHPTKAVVTVTPTAVADAIPVLTSVKEFNVTATGTTVSSSNARRTVADAKKCAACHNTLSLHGEGNTVVSSLDGVYANATDGPITFCTVCHNSANTDVSRRPGTTNTVDGKLEESIDFKRMIHAIHKGREANREQYVVYGFGGSTNIFGGEFPPGADLNTCENCHSDVTAPAAGTYEPRLVTGIEGTTVLSGSLTTHTDDVNISPYSATCSGCHDGPVATFHMQTMGGSFMTLEEDSNYH